MPFPKKLGGISLGPWNVKLFKNTTAKRYGFARVPVRQRLIWLGPVFLLAKRKSYQSRLRVSGFRLVWE